MNLCKYVEEEAESIMEWDTFIEWDRMELNATRNINKKEKIELYLIDDKIDIGHWVLYDILHK